MFDSYEQSPNATCPTDYVKDLAADDGTHKSSGSCTHARKEKVKVHVSYLTM